MKKWLLLCMCFLLIGCQSDERVKEIVTTTFQIENGEVKEPLWHSTETLNEAGQVIETKQEADNGYVLSEGIWTYEDDNLVLIENQNNGKLFETKRKYENDQLVSEHRYVEGRLMGYTLYEYGEGKDRITKEYDQDEILTSIATEDYVSDTEMHVIVAMTALDNPINMIVYFDDEGLKSKDIQETDDSKTTTTYHYDEHGSLIETIHEDGDNTSVWSYDYEYNKQGDYIKKSSYIDGDLYSYEERRFIYN